MNMADLTWTDLRELVERLLIQGEGDAAVAFKQSIINDLVDQKGYGEERARQEVEELLIAKAKEHST